jgi:hypothetical protein
MKIVIYRPSSARPARVSANRRPLGTSVGDGGVRYRYGRSGMSSPATADPYGYFEDESVPSAVTPVPAYVEPPAPTTLPACPAARPAARPAQPSVCVCRR